MTSLLDFPSPPASAYGAKPLSPEDIDAHPDRDRLWATIMEMRAEYDDENLDQFEAGRKDGYEEARNDFGGEYVI